MIAMPLLKVSDFTHIKDGHLLFKNLSFELFAGEMLVLMGPNGSGKTTLLKCLAGIPDVLPSIIKAPNLTQSYVGHLNALKAHQTVRQNLLHQTQVTPEYLIAALAEKRLTPLLDREISTLSVGQKRQMALTRLPLSGAKLWLVDEPTTHLDDAAIALFWVSLEAHLAAGGSVVLSSHTPVPFPQAKVIALHG